MRGQVAIMEYMVFVILAVFMIAFVLVMIFGFQILSIGGDYSAEVDDRSLFILQSILSSKIINVPQYQKGSVLDDAALTIIECEDLIAMFREEIYVEVKSFYEKPNCEGLNGWDRNKCEDEIEDIEAIESTDCTEDPDASYPQCGRWTFCDQKDRMVYKSVPVNIFRKMEQRTSLGVITVGLNRGEQ